MLQVEVEEVTGGRARLAFSVTDSGIGMSPMQVANLFQSFNQADTSFTRKYGGTGLGLAISKQLCELMGGSISVASELDKGSKFRFTANFGIASEGIAREPRKHSLNRSVLIVDDSESARNVLVSMVHANGFLA